MTLTKAELADLLFEQLGLNKREAKDMPIPLPAEIHCIRPSSTLLPLSSSLNPRWRKSFSNRPGCDEISV